VSQWERLWYKMDH